MDRIRHVSLKKGEIVFPKICFDKRRVVDASFIAQAALDCDAEYQKYKEYAEAIRPVYEEARKAAYGAGPEDFFEKFVAFVKVENDYIDLARRAIHYAQARDTLISLIKDHEETMYL